MEFRFPNCPFTPLLVRVSSEKESSGLWQLAHDMVKSDDKMGSKNNFLPNAIPSSLTGLLASNGMARQSVGFGNTWGVGLKTKLSSDSFLHEKTIKMLNKMISKKNEMPLLPILKRIFKEIHDSISIVELHLIFAIITIVFGKMDGISCAIK